MTERQKQIMFCLEGLRNRDRVHVDSGKTAFAEEAMKLFCEEIGIADLYESSLKHRMTRERA